MMKTMILATGLTAVAEAYTEYYNPDIRMNLEEQSNWGKSYPDAHGDEYISLSAADKQNQLWTACTDSKASGSWHL